MTCLEHLIENCLVKFEDSKTKFLDAESMDEAQKYYRIKQTIDEIRKSIENDPNLQYAGITADQCYEICQYIYYSYVPYIIDKQPEQKKGYWIGRPIAGYATVRCSVCTELFFENQGRWNYCPNCGAKMEEEE